MRFKHLFFCFIYMVIFSCKPDTENQKIGVSTNQQPSKEITKKDIENLKFNEFLLSNDASNATLNWQKYKEFNTQLEYLRKGDFSFFKSDLTIITTFINDLKLEIPKALNTNEINARITALETKILKLNSLLTLDNIPKTNQLEALREVFVAFSNLNLQINKKLEFEANNILKPE